MQKIGLMGVHSSGKTTSLFGIAHELKARGKTVALVMETAREARRRGFQINQTSDVFSQLWILTEHIQKEIEARRDRPDYILTDRTIFDTLAYNKINLSPSAAEKIERIALTYFGEWPYDLILFFGPLPKIDDDKVRAIDPAFHKTTSEMMEQVITYYNLEPFVYRVKSKVRIEMTREVLGELEVD